MADEFYNNPDYIALVGSRLYGTNSETSDEDWRGFVVPPLENMIGLSIQKFEQKEFTGQDKIIYSFENFLKNLIRGNTNLLESLFSPNYECSTIGRMVRDHRYLFISKMNYRSIRGFANAEMRKVRGVRLEISDTVPTYKDSIDNLCTTFQLKRFERDAIIDIIEDGRPDLKLKLETPNTGTGGVGEKRRLVIDKCGYDVKSASHVIRLLSEGIELMTTGQLTFPRPEVDTLRRIRAGEYPLEEIERSFKVLDSELTAAYKLSTLPEKCNIAAINLLYTDTIKGEFKNG